MGRQVRFGPSGPRPLCLCACGVQPTTNDRSDLPFTRVQAAASATRPPIRSSRSGRQRRRCAAVVLPPVRALLLPLRLRRPGAVQPERSAQARTQLSGTRPALAAVVASKQQDPSSSFIACALVCSPVPYVLSLQERQLEKVAQKHMKELAKQERREQREQVGGASWLRQGRGWGAAAGRGGGCSSRAGAWQAEAATHAAANPPAGVSHVSLCPSACLCAQVDVQEVRQQHQQNLSGVLSAVQDALASGTAAAAAGGWVGGGPGGWVGGLVAGQGAQDGRRQRPPEAGSNGSRGWLAAEVSRHRQQPAQPPAGAQPDLLCALRPPSPWQALARASARRRPPEPAQVLASGACSTRWLSWKGS